MEHTKTELALLEKATSEINEPKVWELNELQLALVGGGGGDVVFA